MSKKPRDKIMLAEHVFEVRHDASGSFLDVRGYVADYVRNDGLFPHWKIDNNVVNFHDSPDGIKLEGAFAGFKSAGYMVYNPETRNYFVDRAAAYWKSLLKNKHYQVPKINRFGARTKVFLPSNKTFDEIHSTVFETFYTDKAKELIGGQETDVQFIFEFIENNLNVRLTGGPIHYNEAGAYLNFQSSEFENTGVFLDLDYYIGGDLIHDEIPKLLKNAISLAWVKIEKIADALGL